MNPSATSHILAGELARLDTLTAPYAPARRTRRAFAIVALALAILASLALTLGGCTTATAPAPAATHTASYDLAHENTTDPNCATAPTNPACPGQPTAAAPPAGDLAAEHTADPACPNPASYAAAMPMAAALGAHYGPLPAACPSTPVRWTTTGRLLTGWDLACENTGAPADGHAYRWGRDGALLTDTAACDPARDR